MVFDFKKEQREFYLPKRKPEIIKIQMKKEEYISRQSVLCTQWHIH